MNSTPNPAPKAQGALRRGGVAPKIPLVWTNPLTTKRYIRSGLSIPVDSGGQAGVTVSNGFGFIGMYAVNTVYADFQVAPPAAGSTDLNVLYTPTTKMTSGGGTEANIAYWSYWAGTTLVQGRTFRIADFISPVFFHPVSDIDGPFVASYVRVDPNTGTPSIVMVMWGTPATGWRTWMWNFTRGAPDLVYTSAPGQEKSSGGLGWSIHEYHNSAGASCTKERPVFSTIALYDTAWGQANSQNSLLSDFGNCFFPNDGSAAPNIFTNLLKPLNSAWKVTSL